MNRNVLDHLTVALLDYDRPKEAERCLRSIHQFICVEYPPQILYLSNGGNQDHARRWYDEGLIDTLVLNRENHGCGIATKQAFQAALTDWVMYVQVDQYAVRPFTVDDLYDVFNTLDQHADTLLYADLAGNQGHGTFSERALLMRRRDYLDIPGMDEVIGGPGPYAQHKWTERHVQDYMKERNLGFLTMNPFLFADNGKWSQREYGVEYGGAITVHATDTKVLKVLKPFSKRADGFPNLHLSDEEWAEMLAGKWPVEGKIPEADKAHSFVVWEE
jgi:hypothetical protein